MGGLALHDEDPFAPVADGVWEAQVSTRSTPTA